MSFTTANSTFMRQIRNALTVRHRELDFANDRERIFRERCAAAGTDPHAPGAGKAAAKQLMAGTIFHRATLTFTGDRLWVGEGHVGNGLKHQAGLGRDAMEACAKAWDGAYEWIPDHPDPDVIFSIRDWLEPIERWSWDVRRAGEGPEGQPSFW